MSFPSIGAEYSSPFVPIFSPEASVARCIDPLVPDNTKPRIIGKVEATDDEIIMMGELK